MFSEGEGSLDSSVCGEWWAKWGYLVSVRQLLSWNSQDGKAIMTPSGSRLRNDLQGRKSAVTPPQRAEMGHNIVLPQPVMRASFRATEFHRTDAQGIRSGEDRCNEQTIRAWKGL